MRRRIGGEVVLPANIKTSRVRGSLRRDTVSPAEGDFSMVPPAYHLPVMAEEVVRGLSVLQGGVYVDGTLGEGGHSLALLEAAPVDDAAPATGNERGTGGAEGVGLVIGIDLDERSVSVATERLVEFGPRFLPIRGNYADMDSLAGQLGVAQVDGVLLDLGFSSRQIDRAGYGLSFMADEPLDMRYDAGQRTSAAELVNSASADELTDIFRRYGEEPRARAVALAIVRERDSRPIGSTSDLAALVERVHGRRRGHRLHPATRVFQALRIAVNEELENLRAGLEAAVALLRPGGRLAVISYHSLEDRIVKNFMGHQSSVCVCPPGLPECVCGQEPTLAIVNRRIIRPSGEEVAFNPRSRSARLRLARRIQARNEQE